MPSTRMANSLKVSCLYTDTFIDSFPLPHRLFPCGVFLQEAINVVRLPAAIAYRVAASLAPDDPAPFSNLSAVEFEMGHYQEAIELAEKSIALTPSSDQTRLDRFHVRIAKSNLHLLKTVEALSAAEKVTADDIREPLMADIRTVKELIGSSPDQSVARKNILDRLPRYKPCL